MSPEDADLAQRIRSIVEWVTIQNPAKGTELVHLLDDLAGNVHKATMVDFVEGLDRSYGR